MNRPLFIHSKGQVLDRILKESKDAALITTSMVKGLQWVANPEVELSGIFLNPDDTSFSALRFLDLVLTHRPAVPIYLFESDLCRQPDHAKSLMNKTHVKGIFSGTESYSTLISALRSNVDGPSEKKRSLDHRSIHAGYCAIPLCDFYTGTHYPYDIFLESSTGQLLLFAMKDAEIDPQYLQHASQTTEFLFVREDDIQETKNRLKKVKAEFLNDPDFPQQWKTSEVMATAKNILADMKESGINDTLVGYTEKMLSDLLHLVSKLDSDNDDSIYKLIEKAKNCDRAILCAAYYMLICKKLRYEKTSTLEILGLASVLQDLSLLKTPFGDICDKTTLNFTPAEAEYYQKHPILSADLVSAQTEVPQVTLQVIRQHHEKKDNSGFPNRIGGTQIHPMAEILSLINEYYEISKILSDDADTLHALQQSAFPHYSDAVVSAFKMVLGNILKSKSRTGL